MKLSLIRITMLLASSMPMLLGGVYLKAESAATINIDTGKMLALPSRRNFSGANMQIFFTGTSYLDPKMQEIAQKMNLGWVRFPGGTVDDVYDWKTGDMRDEWIAQFKGSPTIAYGDFTSDVPIIRGKGLIKMEDYASFLGTLRTGQGAGSSPTHTIGVINTFTDTPESAAQLVLAAKKMNLLVDVWELGNEPSYFEKFYPSAKAYLDTVEPFAAAIKKADPTARVAVYLDRRPDWMNGVADYKKRYWDELYYHVYPNPSKDPTDAQALSYYNGFLVNMTNPLVDGTFASLFGHNAKFEISEFNIGALHGGLYGAVFIAEYTMRLSSDPHITQMGMHTLVGRETERDADILAKDAHTQDAIAAYRAGKVADTLHKDYGYFSTPDGLALQIINGVINTSDGLWPTSVKGGATVKVSPIGKIGSEGITPALYAQAYANGEKAHLLITNKSGAPQVVVIEEKGKAVQTSLSAVSMGATDLTAHNTADAPETVHIHRDTVNNPVTVPPYGVMDVSWQR